MSDRIPGHSNLYIKLNLGNFNMKRILNIACLVCLALTSAILPGCNNEKVVKDAAIALSERNYKRALENILSLSDRTILQSDSLLTMLSTAYYGLTMQPKSDAASECYDMVFTAAKDSVLLTDFHNSSVMVYKYPEMKLSRIIRIPDTEEEKLFAIDISPDGKSLAAAMEDGSIILMDLATENVTTKLPAHTSRVRDVEFMSDSVIFSCGNDKRITAWEINTQNLLWKSYTNSRNIKNIHLNKDKTLLSAASNDGSACIIDVNNLGRVNLRVIHGDNYVNDAILSPDNNYLVSASGDGDLVIWNALNGIQLKRIFLNDALTSLDISSDGKHILAGGEKCVYIIESASGKIVTQIDVSHMPVWTAKFVNDSEIAFADNSRFWHGPFLQGKDLIEAARKLEIK